MSLTRRSFVDRAVKGSVLTLGFSVGGATVMLTPEEARAQQVAFQKLSPAQVKDIEKLGEVILPGATQAGVAHFLDQQLANDPQDAMLLAKYFGAPLPYADFYAAGLKVAGSMTGGKTIEQLDAAGTKALVAAMAKPGAVVEGFPIFLFYMCLRSDCVDVVYGTPAGFKLLNVPYMEHILPPEGNWNGAS